MYSDKLEKIRAEILKEKIKVVSFDIFDTLLVRPCIEPTDLFKIVKKRMGFEGDFVTIRKLAEKYARKNKLFYHDDVTIDEIYIEFVKLTNISIEAAEKIKKCELEVEYDYLSERHSIKSLYEDAFEAGKEIIILSDMYLPKEFIEKVLKKCGYRGYKNLYVSCEENVAKGSGRLFEKVVKEYERNGIKPEEIVHLGDNTRADVEMPKRYGINSFHLPKPSGIFRSKKKLEPLWRFGKETDNCFVIGALANFIFDDPFNAFQISSISGGKATQLGSILFGPMLMLYTKWLIETSLNDEIKKLLFAYRDGYVIERIFEILKPLYLKAPDVDSVYLSRMVRYHFFADEKHGLFNAFDNYKIPKDMTISEFLKKRLLVDDAEMKEIWELFKERGYPDIDSYIGDPFDYYMLLPNLEPYFRAANKKQIKTIKEYVKDKTNSKKVGIVDVGYRGSVSRFLVDHCDIENIGYQLLSTPKCVVDTKKDYVIKSFYEYSFGTVEKCGILHSLVEDIISIQEGTAIGIEKMSSGYKILREEYSEDKKIEEISEIQNGIIDFVKYAYQNIRYDFKNMEFDKMMFFDFLIEFLERPAELDAKIIRKLCFYESEFIKSKNDTRDFYNIWYKQRFPAKKNSLSNVLPEIDNANEPWEKISRPHLYAIKLCERLHIIKLVIKIKKKVFKNSSNAKTKDFLNEFFISKINVSIDKVIKINNSMRAGEEKVLIAGAMTSFDKGTCNFINNLAYKLKNEKVILMSENAFLDEKRTTEKIKVPFFIVPKFLAKDQYEKPVGLVVSRNIKKEINGKDYLKWGKNNILARHNDIPENYVYFMLHYTKKYLKEVLDILKPTKVILWNEFYAVHHILKNLCMEMNIDVEYMEFGSLPGTISIEKIGQMGESYPGKFHSEFKQLPISNQEIQMAEKVITFLKSSKLNRNIQPLNNNISKIKEKLDSEKPVILYAGVNDFESGLVPYNENARKNHSPFLKSSKEGLQLLMQIASKNDWNIIYKPHPIIESQIGDYVDNSNEKDIIIAKQTDINDLIDVADVVVTILSQVSYTALIRGKATVLLGYTQLRGQGACYEAFRREEVEKVIKDALSNGITNDQYKNFIEHVARMNKYNLFDDMQTKPIVYAQSIDKAANFLLTCNNSKEWYINSCDRVNLSNTEYA